MEAEALHVLIKWGAGLLGAVLTTVFAGTILSGIANRRHMNGVVQSLKGELTGKIGWEHYNRGVARIHDKIDSSNKELAKQMDEVAETVTNVRIIVAGIAKNGGNK